MAKQAPESKAGSGGARGRMEGGERRGRGRKRRKVEGREGRKEGRRGYKSPRQIPRPPLQHFHEQFKNKIIDNLVEERIQMQTV